MLLLASTVLKGESGIYAHASLGFPFLFMPPWSSEFSELYSGFSLIHLLHGIKSIY